MMVLWCLRAQSRSLLVFCDVLNTALPNIKITYSYSRFQVDFLDVVIYKCMEDAVGSPDGTGEAQSAHSSKGAEQVPLHSISLVPSSWYV